MQHQWNAGVNTVGDRDVSRVMTSVGGASTRNECGPWRERIETKRKVTENGMYSCLRQDVTAA